MFDQEEVWKPIKSKLLINHEISDHGNIRKLNPSKGRKTIRGKYIPVKKRIDSGRITIRTTKVDENGKRYYRNYALTRLMCFAFNGPPPDYTENNFIEDIIDYVAIVFDMSLPVTPRNLTWVKAGKYPRNETTKQFCAPQIKNNVILFPSVKYKTKALDEFRKNNEEIKTKWVVNPFV